MTTLEQYRRVADALLAVEAEMRQIGLWSAQAPSPEALQSVMPFMYDTLQVHEWLQFVFIPRTAQIIESGGRLPGNCHIHPLAEHQFASVDAPTTHLLGLILQMDEAMNAS